MRASRGEEPARVLEEEEIAELLALAEDDDEEPEALDALEGLRKPPLPVVSPTPEAPKAPPETPPKPSPEPAAELLRVRTAAILPDPADNFAKGGAAIAETPSLRRHADRLRRYGLRFPLTVERLPVPIHGPNPGLEPFEFRLISGFRDHRAAELAELAEVEVRLVSGLTPTKRILLNLAESAREDPTDFERAQGFHRARKASVPLEDIAHAVGWSLEQVETLERIIARAPVELVEVFRVDCSPKTRRILERVSQIEGFDGPNGFVTRRLQLDAWASLTATEDPVEEEPKRALGPVGRARRTLGYSAVQAMRAKLLEALEWQDPTTGLWRPIDSANPRELADALLFAIVARKPCPLR